MEGWWQKYNKLSCKQIRLWEQLKARQVKSDDLKTPVIAFRKALPLGSPFQGSLTKSGLTTMEALLSKANHYANIKEEMRVVESKPKCNR